MSEDFGEIFEIELRCWCYGLSKAQGRIDASVLHKVIREFAPVLKEAIDNLYTCDILEIARDLIKAAKCHVSEKEIAFYILSQLPTPAHLSLSQTEVLKQLVGQVEQKYGGAFSRLERKWKAVKQEKKASDFSDLGPLSFPQKAS